MSVLVARVLRAARRPDHGQPAAALGAHRRRARSSILVPAAFGQLLAALAASALAAIDSYGTAAAGFALGGIAGLVVFAALADAHGIVALAWGLAVNAAVAFAVPAVALAAQARARRRRARSGSRSLPRLWQLLQGAAVPLALQGCYLLALRFAAQLGVGSVTSFSYAYLAASTLVGATAFSLGLISSAPLTRRGIDPGGGGPARRARGVGEPRRSSVPRPACSRSSAAASSASCSATRTAATSAASSAISSCISSPWMVAWVGFAVTFPLVFVAEKRWTLVPLAALGFAPLHPARARPARRCGGCPGSRSRSASRRSSSRSG